MIKQDDIIEIGQVANGFIVRVASSAWFDNDRSRGVWTGERADYMVFRTMVELQQWLADHFTHRAAPKLVDLMPPHKPEAKIAKKAA